MRNFFNMVGLGLAGLLTAVLIGWFLAWVLIAPVCYAFDRIMPYESKTNWERVDRNFRNIIYTRVNVPPSTTTFSCDISCDDTASVSVATVNSDTGNYVTQLTQSQNNLTVKLNTTSLATTEVSIITIYR